MYVGSVKVADVHLCIEDERFFGYTNYEKKPFGWIGLQPIITKLGLLLFLMSLNVIA